MPLIAKRILAKAMNGYPLNKELCLEIYNTIVTSNMADISQIGEDSLVAYRKLANFSGTSGMVKTVPQIQPITAPNPQEVLAAHIDSNLIKEREYYEREMEGTTVRTKPVPALRNYSYESQHSSYDNRSRTSSSEELYFMPTPRLTPFAQKSNSQPSPNNLNSAFDMDTVELDAVLRFEPPSEIDPYVPEIVRMNDAR